MRISTAYNYQTTVSELQARQSDMVSAQERMSSGKRVTKPSDDPAAMARAERALSDQSRAETRLRAIDASRNRMTLTEAALGRTVDLTQSVRETLIAAGDAGYSSGERDALVVQLKGLRQQLLGQANQADGNGGYLFGGQGMTTEPFADLASGVAAQVPPQDSAYNAAREDNLPLTVDGRQVWLTASTGNGSFVTAPDTPNKGGAWISAGNVTDPGALQGASYQLSFSVNAAGQSTYSVSTFTKAANGVNTLTPVLDNQGKPVTGVPYQSGKTIAQVPGMSFQISGTPANGDIFSITPSTPSLSVFTAIDNAVAGLSNKSASGTQIAQTVHSALRDVDQVLSRFQAARAEVGGTLNRLDGLQNSADARVLSAKTARSDAQDADMVQAVSEFSNRQTSYQAALQSYSMVQKLSMFQYINN
jgi:flagellar hook-associated protein 3 FlgL